jgi:hypothetical protein
MFFPDAKVASVPIFTASELAWATLHMELLPLLVDRIIHSYISRIQLKVENIYKKIISCRLSDVEQCGS